MSILLPVANMLRGHAPGQLIIQITDRCNATCPQCAMRVSNSFSRSTLGTRQCMDIITRARRNGVQALSITGGEPLLYLDEVCTLMKHANQIGIKYTRTGTNGFLFRNPEKPNFQDRVKKTAEKLAKANIRNFWISIDSAVPEIHEQMRGFTNVIKGIELAIPIFHEFGLYPTANMGVNRNLGGQQKNIFTTGPIPETTEQAEEFVAKVTEGLQDFFQLVTGMGFTIVNFCYPMSVEKDDNDLEAVYPASSTERIVKFTKHEKSLIFKAMRETIPRYRSKIRIFSPLSSLHVLQSHYNGDAITPFPCRGGIDHFFINANDGNTYPCGYRGMDNLGAYRQGQLSTDKKAFCTRCDWECFRDPSELGGPLVHGLSEPLSLFKKYKRDKTYYRLWKEDFKYYRACNFFNGRKPFNQNNITRFKV